MTDKSGVSLIGISIHVRETTATGPDESIRENPQYERK
jgi:hypothetical protein